MSDPNLNQAMSSAQLMTFPFEGKLVVRCLWIDDAPWFVATDLCRAIGTRQPTRALSKLDEDEKGVTECHTNRGKRTLLVVSESGMWTLVVRSNAAMVPGTQPYRARKWITAEVMPALRKTGRYEMPGQKQHRTEGAKLSLVREKRQTFGLAAAAQLWVDLGLPTNSKSLRGLDQREFSFGKDLDSTLPRNAIDVN
jgi:prophage antirepressor-like protein